MSQMSTKLPPATMIMTFHKEGHLAQKSLLGMQRIREYSAQFGHEVRLICMLDCADELTTYLVKSYIHQCGMKNDQVIECQYGSLAASRNTGIDNVQTEYLGFLDGDDFVSAHWVQAALNSQLTSRNLPTINTPKYVISFGAKVEHFEMLNSKNIPLVRLMGNNFWSSVTFGHISTYVANPYNEVIDKNIQFVFEDWDFNLRCIASGVTFEPVEDTYLFYRRRENSMVMQHAAKRLFTPPSKFFEKIML